LPLILQSCNGLQIDSANGLRQGDRISIQQLIVTMYLRNSMGDHHRGSRGRVLRVRSAPHKPDYGTLTLTPVNSTPPTPRYCHFSLASFSNETQTVPRYRSLSGSIL